MGIRRLDHRWNIINPLNAELNPICHLLALLGAHLIFHVSRIRVTCISIFRKDEDYYKKCDTNWRQSQGSDYIKIGDSPKGQIILFMDVTL
jgi:hypothetical protein